MKKIVIMLFISLLFVSCLNNHLLADDNDYEYGDAQSVDYILNGTMPSYVLSQYDKDGNETLVDSEYTYAYVFDDVNDYYLYNAETSSYVGNQPKMDTGVLVGGNAYSKYDNNELDIDYNNFNNILPYANIYIIKERLSSEKGEIEYEFFSDLFNYNNSKQNKPENISIKGTNKTITSYMKKYSSATGNSKNDNKPFHWQGVIYTGGIKKTHLQSDGSYNETVISNDDNALFTVRYKGAAVDHEGNVFDLLLSFKKIVFVAEADVNGPFEIFEENKLCVAPILYEDGKYTIVIDDSSDDENATSDGIRIGTHYEYDYEFLSSENKTADGLIMFSMNDLDNASMANSLQTDANWGSNDLGNDFKWAEGFGVVDGAASFAILPYYNHDLLDVNGEKIDNHNGDKGLLRISRMKDTTADGSANGLYFTTAITSNYGYGSRNDSNTMDTGVSMLLKPKGSFVSTISAGRRGDVNITLFETYCSHKIEQISTEGGVLYSSDYSFLKDGKETKNTGFMKVVGSGSTSTHYFKADWNYDILDVRIDDMSIDYRHLQWSQTPEGDYKAKVQIIDEYGRNIGTSEYTLYRNNKGLVWVSFENIQDDHVISVKYVHYGMFGILRNINEHFIFSLFILSGFFILFAILAIRWMKLHKNTTVE